MAANDLVGVLWRHLKFVSLGRYFAKGTKVENMN